MDSLLRGLAANPALPADLVDVLIAQAGPVLADELASRPDLTRAQTRALFAQGPECGVALARAGRLTAADVDPMARPDVALALLEEGAGEAGLARVLARSAVVEHRERLAACSGLPDDVVALLAADGAEGVVAELALWAPAEVAARLAGHASAAVRRAAACNEATPPAVLAALLTRDGLASLAEAEPCAEPRAIRDAALLNPATPVSAILPHLDHEAVWPSWGPASRTDLPPEAYELLAGHLVPGVRETVAQNRAITESLLHRLAEDTHELVRRGAAHNPRLPLALLDRLTATTKLGPGVLPRIAAATPGETEQLARSRNPELRMLVAGRRDLPPRIRDLLAEDPDAKVAKSIAPHPGLTESQLRAMAERHGSRVYAKVTENQATPSSLLEELAAKSTPVRKALRAIARHPHATDAALRVCLTDVQARVPAASHPALAPSTLAALLDHADWQVVEAAAAHPALPRERLRELVSAQLP
ncbi:hypothetical protein H9Y04_23670 [Streptomyces sp. TRM66268-LWL]|uniref:Leucine rich repeat variant n=1 Tax=Streptomyces polyasparticus TaxID=2767826 RepID=A0ABR7SJA1_9ACTN|nr:hypothetical protein [Streptomyces polyasparticus]